MGRIRELFSLYRLYGKLDLNWFLQDMPTCAIVIVSELFANIASIAGVLLLAARFGGVGGLSSDEVLFLLGFFELAGGFTYMCFGGFNCLEISRRVARGQIDHMLIQPRPLWMQLMGEGFMPITGSYGFLTGLALTCIACARLHIVLSLSWALAFLFYVLIHAAIKISQSYLYGSLAFYRPVACEEISSIIVDFGQSLGKYPLVGLPNWLRISLETVLPVGLTAYVPAMALLGKLDKGAAYALPVAVTVASITLASYFFRKGLKHYAKFSCNRYRDIGHRN